MAFMSLTSENWTLALIDGTSEYRYGEWQRVIKGLEIEGGYQIPFPN